MDKKEILLTETEQLCQAIGIDFKETGQELLNFISPEPALEHCITRGPSPDFPDTLADIFVLGESCLYDFEIRQQGNLRHAIPLNKVQEIGERFAEMGGVSFLCIHFQYGSIGGGLVLSDSTANKGKLRRFSNFVKNKLGNKSKEAT